MSDGVVDYARFAEPLLDIAGKPVGEISILRSFEGAQRRVARLTTRNRAGVAGGHCGRTGG